MSNIVFITPDVAVAGALFAEDFQQLARQGFKAIVNNRPDGEEASQLSAREAAVHAWRAGLLYRHVPVTKHELFDDRNVEAMADALMDLEGPVLLHCKSGQRSALLWAAVAARSESIDCVLDTLKAAGFDFSAMREEFAAQVGRKRTLGRVAKVDCGTTSAVAA